jgi:hypothetical protein
MESTTITKPKESTTPTTVAFDTIIGEMYARCTLDYLIEQAYEVSNDFISRPHLYQESIAGDIVELRMSYGTSRNYPNMQQRQRMYMPVFGKLDGLRPDSNSYSQFHLVRKKLIDASIAYSERVYDSGLDMLRERIRSAVIPLRSHLTKLQGYSVQSSYDQTKAIFDLAVDVLKSPVVAKVFGLEQPEPNWPLDSDDPEGAKLVEAIGATLKIQHDYILTFDRFILLQRVAREGREALRLVLTTDTNKNDELEKLVTKVYTWGSSLRDFLS